VHIFAAEAELVAFAEPITSVAETIAGPWHHAARHPLNRSAPSGHRRRLANTLAAEADVVLAVGTRLQDFSTGSWTVFPESELPADRTNAARFDAHKHRVWPSSATHRPLAELSRGCRGGRRRGLA